MKKIPTCFERDWDGDRSRVLDQVAPGCEWVADGEGVATRKYDGMCSMIRGGKLYKRHEVKAGKRTPELFEAVETDAETGNVVGWVPVGDGPEDKWFRQACDGVTGTLPDGTYELVGPKVQGNPEGYGRHALVRHAIAQRLDLRARDYGSIRDYLTEVPFEGIVFQHPDGRMAKIKSRDFGIKRTL